MAFYNNVIAGAAGAGSAGGATDYQISKSLRFSSGDSSYLSRTPASAGNSKTFTFSCWLKKSGINSSNRYQLLSSLVSGSVYFTLEFETEKLKVFDGGAISGGLATDGVFRDPSAWYHIVCAVDTTDGTAANRVKLYVNGVQQTLTGTQPSQNSDLAINTTTSMSVGALDTGSIQHTLDGYLAEVHFIDGQALAPTDFGEFDSNNFWQLKKFTHGTAKHTGDWIGDTVGTPYSAPTGSSKAFDGDDSTAAAPTTSSAFVFTPSTPITGISKVRIRVYRDSQQNDDDGLQLNGTAIGSNWTAGGATSEVEFNVNNLTSLRWETNSITHWYKVYKIEIYYDGAYHTLVPGDINSFHLDFSDATSNQALGYDSSISSPALNNKGGFDAITYTGNGGTQTIKGLAFQPDFVWLKARDQSYYHILVDSVRGKTKELYSNDHSSSATTTNTVTSFNSNGFSLGNRTNTNQNGTDYVAWAWKAGGTASSNTDGSQTSSVSANTTYGFSIVTGTQSANNTVNTYGHGLGAEPKMILLKRTDGSEDWYVYHKELGNTSRIQLNSTSAVTTGSGVWGSTTPTSSVFTIQSFNAGDFVAYCWSEVSGFSKFSSYTGNGSTSGPTVTTGFKPRYVLLKHSSGSGNNWMILDSARAGDDKLLFASSSGAENTGTDRVKFTDTGFQILDSSGGFNTNGETYIYAAFGDRAGNNFTTNNLIATAGLETASQGMDVLTYTGNGSTQSITGLNFQPDFVWLKKTSASADHYLYDVVRGANNRLYSNTTGAESTSSTGLTAFNSDGFTVGSANDVNQSSNTYVAWAWKAGGTASSNSNGTITSSVSANQTYGFSIVSYNGDNNAGDTVGHGLGSAPKWILVKNRDDAFNWYVYHHELGATKYLRLDTTATEITGSGAWNNTAPTSTVFSLGQDNNVNDGNKDYIAYCWSEIPGFSKFGSYIGNGSSTGPVVTTGFKPKYLLIKSSTVSGAAWYLWDSVRDTSNPRDKVIQINTDGQQDSGAGYNINFNNDGFQIVSASDSWNRNNDTFLYMAFADKPPGEIIDSLIDTPMDITADSGNNPGNYATLNPLQNGGLTLSNGNLDVAKSAAGWATTTGTIGISSGKYYFEYTASTAYDNHMIGVVTSDVTLSTYLGNYASGWGYQSNGNKVHADSFTGSQPTANSGGDIIQVAVDMDAGKIWFGINGTYIGSGNPSSGANPAYSNLSGTVFPAVSHAGTLNGSFNFGARDFSYTPPTNFVSICTTNLPDPTIADPSTAFEAKTYTGTDNSNAITGLGHSPDLLWIKRRSGNSGGVIFDQIRGVTKALETANSGADKNNDPPITSFDADGFTVGGSYSQVNANNETYIAWSWDAGSSNTSVSVGGLNSSAYNQSQTWSTYGTFTGSYSGSYDWAGVFAASNTYDAAGSLYLASGTGKWTLTSSLACNSEIKIYVNGASSFTINEGLSDEKTVASTSSGFHYVVIPFSGNISSIKLNTATQYTIRIYVDGAALIDQGITLGGAGVPNVPTIASTVRANPSTGFSIIQYTAAGSTGTISHQLNAVPDFILAKSRTSTGSWMTYHSAYPGGTHGFNFQATTGVYTDSGYWNGVSPDSNVITLGSYTSSAYDWIAYCWSAVEGYSSFGKYTGNGSADGPFIYTGYRVKWLLTKRSDGGANDWQLIDATRSPSNVADDVLKPNTSGAEGTHADYGVDFLSNGFKHRTAHVARNGSGNTYIYAAFAEHPLKTARAR